ncbi:MAG TPA: hypothetical protein VFK89_10900 [Actinomycetota bacterium]|nr:hypothetical protein [Actinomycetota bacterium]
MKKQVSKSAKIGTRRSRSALAVVVLLLAALVHVEMPASQAAESTTTHIEFLNPSNFATATGVGVIVSDKLTVDPDSVTPTGGDTTYRLSAWVQNVPVSPAVEFEVLRAGVSLATIDESARVGNDTFEADWDIPSTLPDGPYTLRATIASNGLGVASADMDVVIQRTADRAEIIYPRTRGSGGDIGAFGSYAALATAFPAQGSAARQAPVGEVEGLNTGFNGEGASRVRAFYTTSAPGTQPDWKVCGTEFAPGDVAQSGAANNGVRCTLESGTDAIRVTAVALLANDTNRASYDAHLNQAGDATRVLGPYEQVPTTFTITDGDVQTVSRGRDSSFSCSSTEVQLTDQVGHEILNANVDVHAVGPTDGLKFGTGPFDDSSQPPDRGAHATENGYDCVSRDENAVVTEQGEHQVVGGPDLKHLEMTDGGTNDDGIWSFALHVPAEGPTESRFTTYFTTWVDELATDSPVNDDCREDAELAKSGMVGWGQDPAGTPPSTEPACATNPPCPSPPTQGSTGCSPSPSPSPSTSPTTSPPPVTQSLSIHVSDRAVRAGKRIVFRGQLDSSDPACVAGRQIALQSRRRRGAYKTKVMTSTDDDGVWRIPRRLRHTRTWRAIATSNGACDQVGSQGIFVKVRQG